VTQSKPVKGTTAAVSYAKSYEPSFVNVEENLNTTLSIRQLLRMKMKMMRMCQM
jgi:flagellar basal body rod protein FlgF